MLTKQPRSSFLGLNWAMAAVNWVFDGWRRRPAVQKLLRRMACQEVWYGGSRRQGFMRRRRRSGGDDEVDYQTRYSTNVLRELSHILIRTLQYCLFALQAGAHPQYSTVANYWPSNFACCLPHGAAHLRLTRYSGHRRRVSSARAHQGTSITCAECVRREAVQFSESTCALRNSA